MHLPRIAPILALALAGALGAAPATADTLLVERVRQEAGPMPSRGASMAAVKARFGEPSSRLEPRGGGKRQWPAIHRWVYPGFTVYFERDRVIDAVANKADADEIGPKPPIR